MNETNPEYIKHFRDKYKAISKFIYDKFSGYSKRLDVIILGDGKIVKFDED